MKKFVAILLVVCMMAGMLTMFAACNKDFSSVNILYIGDSIAEAVAGPSPIEERGNYGYFGIIGQINGYQYQNRAISGNQTQELLSYVEREQEDGYRTKTLIASADVICISITGNDLLWHNFPMMMYEIAAKEKYGDDYVNSEVVKACYEYHRYQVIDKDGNMRTIEKGEDLSTGEWRAVAPGDGLDTFNRCIATATKNVNDIVAALRKQNKDATIIFQNVYNPVDDESEMIPIDLVADMIKLDPKYKFSTDAGVAEYRRLGAYMLGELSNILETVAAKNDKVEFLDVAKAFDDIYKADMQRGKDLIFVDGVHPSDQGHAAIACAMQEKLVKLGYAEKRRSLAKYKELRIDQLERMYKGIEGFDYEAACKKIKKAKKMQAVSDAYFDAVAGYVPVLSKSPVEGKPTNGVHVATKETYDLTRVVNRRSTAYEQSKLDDTMELVSLAVKEKKLTLAEDGTMEIEIKVPLGELVPLLATANINFDGTVLGGIEDNYYMDEQGNLTGMKLSGALDTAATIKAYADALFPGIGFADGTLGKNFHMIFDSLGLAIEGLEPLLDQPYKDEVGLPMNMAKEGTVDELTVGKTYASYADYLVAYILRYQEVVDKDGKVLHVSKLPVGVTEKVMSLETITVRIKTVYSLGETWTENGLKYQAIYCGPYQENTTPWLILTKYEEKEDEDSQAVTHVSLNFEILGMIIQF